MGTGPMRGFRESAGFYTALIIIGLIVIGSVLNGIRVHKSCDGVVQENYWGWPSCVAAGGTK